MRFPDQAAASELVQWSPEGGVISVYLEIDPADRGEGWRIELRNGLDQITDVPGAERRPLEAAVGRIQTRFPPDAPHPEGRTQIGFVEVAEKGGREEWFAAQMPIGSACVEHGPRPVLAPLITLLDDGAERGVAVVSAERVRLLTWRMGAVEEVGDWGLEIFSLDWRERKAQRTSDPVTHQGSRSSGRDQFDQRLEANRGRFLREAGRLAAAALTDREATELLVFGDAQHSRELIEGASAHAECRHVDEHDLIAAPLEEIGDRVSEAIGVINREREMELVERASGAAHAGRRGALGTQETLQALREGRVEHLLIDPDRDWQSVDAEVDLDGAPTVAALAVALALNTSAKVTPVEGEAAEALEGADGIAAILRY